MGSSPPPAKRRRASSKSAPSPVATTEKKESPLVVFAHGAGAPSSSDWMVRWKEMLGKALNAVEVITFDYPYFSGGKQRAPPKAEKLVDFHAEVVKEGVAKYPGHPLILAGKSMGSRVSCMVACKEDISASAILCLGYPLKGTNGALRDEILLQQTVPIMFVQGNKDGLCPLEKLEFTRKKMKSVTGLHVIDGGDHSFKIGKKIMKISGTTQDQAEELAVEAVKTFLSESLGESKSHYQQVMDMRRGPKAASIKPSSTPAEVNPDEVYLELATQKKKKRVYGAGHSSERAEVISSCDSSASHPAPPTITEDFLTLADVNDAIQQAMAQQTPVMESLFDNVMDRFQRLMSSMRPPSPPPPPPPPLPPLLRTDDDPDLRDN